MRKYRCPYCGEEAITTFMKAFQLNTAKARNGSQMKHRCPRCSKSFMPFRRYQDSKGNTIFANALIFLILLSILSFVMLLIFRNHVSFFVFFSFWVVTMFIIGPLSNLLSCGITQFSTEQRENIFLSPNAVVEITTPTIRIDNLDILGIRFSDKTRVVRLAEAFTGGIVPAIFYKKNKDQQPPLQVTFMKTKFIPAELLYVGARFTVVDNDKDIATGTILELLEDTSKT